MLFILFYALYQAWPSCLTKETHMIKVKRLRTAIRTMHLNSEMCLPIMNIKCNIFVQWILSLYLVNNSEAWTLLFTFYIVMQKRSSVNIFLSCVHWISKTCMWLVSCSLVTPPCILQRGFIRRQEALNGSLVLLLIIGLTPIGSHLLWTTPRAFQMFFTMPLNTVFLSV